MTSEDFLSRVIAFHFWRFWGFSLSLSTTGVWLYSCIRGRIVTGDDAFVTLFLSLTIAFGVVFLQLLVAFTVNSSSPFNIVGDVVRVRSFPAKETSFNIDEVRTIEVREAPVPPLLDLVVRRSRIIVKTRSGEILSKFFFCGPRDVNRDVERELRHDLYIAQGHYGLVTLPNEGRTSTYRSLPSAGLQAIAVPVILVLVGALLNLAFNGMNRVATEGFVACLVVWGVFSVARFIMWQFIFGRRRITVEGGVARVRTVTGTREYPGVSRVRVVRGEPYAGFKLFAPPTYLAVHYLDDDGPGVVEMRMPRAATAQQMGELPASAVALLALR